MTSLGPKKRKVSVSPTNSAQLNSDVHPNAATVKVENATPDVSNLSPIQKILLIELCKDDKDAVLEGLRQLATMCVDANDANFIKNRATISNAGGQLAIVRAMWKWPNVPGIQAEGCRALANVAAGFLGALGACFRETAKATASLETIVWAMKNYPNDQNVQANGCGALATMSFYKENAEHLVNNLDGVSTIIAVMRMFPNESKVQKYACQALKRSSAHEELREPIVDAGGLEVLGAAIRIHKDNSDKNVEVIQKDARAALKQLV